MVSASVYDSSLNCVLTFIQLIVEGWHSNSNKLIFETFFLFKSYKICSWTILIKFSRANILIIQIM